MPIGRISAESRCGRCSRVRYDSWVIETPDSPTPGDTPTPESTSTETIAAVDGPAAWYQDRRDRFRAEAAELAIRAAHLANLRLLIAPWLPMAAFLPTRCRLATC